MKKIIVIIEIISFFFVQNIFAQDQDTLLLNFETNKSANCFENGSIYVVIDSNYTIDSIYIDSMIIMVPNDTVNLPCNTGWHINNFLIINTGDTINLPDFEIKRKNPAKILSENHSHHACLHNGEMSGICENTDYLHIIGDDIDTILNIVNQFFLDKMNYGGYVLTPVDNDGCHGADINIKIDTTKLFFDDVVNIEIINTTCNVSEDGKVILYNNYTDSITINNELVLKDTNMFPAGTYLITAYKEGCYIQKDISIGQGFSECWHIYKNFTPNGDGINDCFYIDHPDGSIISVNIYSMANNQLIYSNDNYQNDWDGDSNDGDFLVIANMKINNNTFYKKIVINIKK